MNIEQEHTDFEMWCHTRSLDIGRDDKGDYISLETYLSWEGYQAGRAALQSQTIPASDWFDMFMELARAVVVANRLFAVSPTTTKQKVAADAAIALQEHARKHPALQSQDREDAPFLQEDDQHDLHRFIETTEDGQGYDIGKDKIKRLAELGVVCSQGFGRYSVTMFGYWCHEKYWQQNPSLPLKTIDEHNAERAIDHARRIEGEATKHDDDLLGDLEISDEVRRQNEWENKQ
jgi:hypothetical protein